MEKLKHTQILIIADSPIQALMYQDMLQTHEINATSVSNIDDIISLENINLIIFDEHNLENQSKEIAKMIKNGEKYINSIIITSDTNKNRKSFLKKTGYDRILNKPLNLLEFVQIVREFFNEYE